MVVIVTIYDQGIIRAMQTDGAGFTRDVAREISALAQTTCPSESGRLRASHEVVQNRVRGRFAVGYAVEVNSRHALWVHEGTGIFGPRGVPIVPIRTEKRMFMHTPPQYGFRWKLTTRGGMPVYDPNDPHGHLKSEEGQRGQPWLETAGREVAAAHGAW